MYSRNCFTIRGCMPAGLKCGKWKSQHNRSANISLQHLLANISLLPSIVLFPGQIRLFAALPHTFTIDLSPSLCCPLPRKQPPCHSASRTVTLASFSDGLLLSPTKPTGTQNHEPRGPDRLRWPRTVSERDQHMLDLLQNPKNPEDLTIDRADMHTCDRLAE